MPRRVGTHDVADRVRELLALRPPRLGGVRLLAVDGPSGSGKTTLAAELALALGPGALVLPTDLLATWDRPFDWWPELEDGVLTPLAAGRPGRLATVAWLDGEPVPGPVRTVPVPEVLILEGVSSARRAVTDRLSASLWVELADPAQRLERAVARDGAACREPLIRWQHAEQAFFAADGARQRADLLLVLGRSHR